MAGSRVPRNVNSRFMRARDEDPDAEEGSSDGRRPPGAAVATATAGGADLL